MIIATVQQIENTTANVILCTIAAFAVLYWWINSDNDEPTEEF